MKHHLAKIVLHVSGTVGEAEEQGEGLQVESDGGDNGVDNNDDGQEEREVNTITGGGDGQPKPKRE